MRRNTSDITRQDLTQTRAEVAQEWADGRRPDFSVTEGRQDTWDVPTVNMRRRQLIPVILPDAARAVTAEMADQILADLQALSTIGGDS